MIAGDRVECAGAEENGADQDEAEVEHGETPGSLVEFSPR
jgi:hypothetical protein